MLRLLDVFNSPASSSFLSLPKNSPSPTVKLLARDEIEESPPGLEAKENSDYAGNANNSRQRQQIRRQLRCLMSAVEEAGDEDLRRVLAVCFLSILFLIFYIFFGVFYS